MNVLQRFGWVVAALLAATVVIIISGRGASPTGAAAMQDITGFDRRINLLEQRFYRLEQSISRLEQHVSSQRSTGSSSGQRDREVDLISQELQRLQLRMNEVECGLLKLDTRTAVTSGDRRSSDARTADPCRQNPSLPLRLPSRP